MNCLRNISLKRKLTTIIMVTSITAVGLACAAFVAYEQSMFRREMVLEASVTAEMIGHNSSAALSFIEPASAEEVLRALSADSSITAAAVYRKEGDLFAQFEPADAKQSFMPPPVQGDGHRFEQDHLGLFRKINHAGETIGTVYLQYSLRELGLRWKRYALIAAVLILGSSLVAFLFSEQLQRVVSEPVLHLARVAKQVAKERDYSIRAVEGGKDELGQLINGFNEMLSQIQARDTELHRGRELLEQRVEERTRALRQEVLDRERSEEALRRSHQRFEIVTQATSDAIWDWNLQRNSMWWNENFQTLFGYQPAEIGLDGDSWRSRIHPEDAPAVLRSVEDLIAGAGHLWSGEYRFRRRDGSYAHVFDRAYILRDERGQPVRMIGALQDITERKEAEATLAEAHAQLLEASRRAGMAEVATGVLHNVGNVLNSVNVSATLVADRLKKSKAAHLTKVVALLDGQGADLGDFITRDPKGRCLPGFLAQLAEQLVAEQHTMMKEVDLLRSSIEHIKDIVAMQQNYARNSGVIDSWIPAQLVEDALRINAAGLTRHGVKVVREFDDVPPIVVDRHKVLQILINLIRNAKYALDEACTGERRLTLRIRESAPGRVGITVRDTGIGIAPEHLTRIFANGFTTKRDGHGFGLHSGANDAREMGGSLSAESDGPGHGATFTLDLPSSPNRN